MVSVENSNIKDLSFVLSSQSNLDAIDFPFSKVDILNTKFMLPHLKPLIYFFNGRLEVNVFIGYRNQTDIYVWSWRPESSCKRSYHIHWKFLLQSYFFDNKEKLLSQRDHVIINLLILKCQLKDFFSQSLKIKLLRRILTFSFRLITLAFNLLLIIFLFKKRRLIELTEISLTGYVLSIILKYFRSSVTSFSGLVVSCQRQFNLVIIIVSLTKSWLIFFEKITENSIIFDIDA